MARAPAASIPRTPDRQNPGRARQKTSASPSPGVLEPHVYGAGATHTHTHPPSIPRDPMP
eukprot:3505317-Pyramimonas_sp.AAC.1